jgi:phage terminase large subunit-like protein
MDPMMNDLPEDALNFVLADPEIAELAKHLSEPLYSFTPRPDDPINYDEQSSFVFDDFDGIKVCLAGNASGKSVCAAYAVVRYLLNTPAPRDLCPFLICSQSFDMCGAIAQEKLAPFLRGMIESAKWRNVARQFPAEYVLKPSVNGNRWVLDFRSYEQGRQQFQAISAGGFWCDEQMSDWQIVTELVMRCRDYSKTLKMITLTPLEPAYDLESIYQRRHEFEISRSYKFSRMNTMKNMELSSSWRESFFDVVPEDMVATRQLGAFAAFEGLIYKEFRDEVHLFKQKKRAPVNAIHFRSIDFGFRNAACLWAYELAGNFYVYDELLIHNTLTESFSDQINKISKSWGWVDGDVAYSTTYADWEDPAAMVRMRNVGIPCVPARKDVGAGIDCVRGKFIGAGKIPQLYISEKCVELIRELKEYVWMKPAKNPWNLANEVDKPVKYHDHLCFPAGQLVNTPSGFVSIESLKFGDEVLSHLGLARVDACGKTGELPIVKVNFVDGRTILCSEDHPLATSDGGWIEAVNSLGMEIDVCKSKLDERGMGIKQSMSSMGVSGGIVTQRWMETSIMGTDVISVGMNDMMGGCAVSGCISKSGWITMVRFQLGLWFIMLMGIKPIMRLRTWCLKRIQSIQKIMDILKLRLRQLRFGMGLRKVVSGILSMRRIFGMMFNRQSTCVNNVAESMRVGSSIPLSSVVTIVNPQHGTSLELITSNECAGAADSSLLSTSTERRSFARMNVESLVVGSVEKVGVSEVFNLSTSDGTFFVNGVLVSNCDALRYLIYSRECSIIKPWSAVKAGASVKQRAMMGR